MFCYVLSHDTVFFLSFIWGANMTPFPMQKQNNNVFLSVFLMKIPIFLTKIFNIQYDKFNWNISFNDFQETNLSFSNSTNH